MLEARCVVSFHIKIAKFLKLKEGKTSGGCFESLVIWKMFTPNTFNVSLVFLSCNYSFDYRWLSWWWPSVRLIYTAPLSGHHKTPCTIISAISTIYIDPVTLGIAEQYYTITAYLPSLKLIRTSKIDLWEWEPSLLVLSPSCGYVKLAPGLGFQSKIFQIIPNYDWWLYRPILSSVSWQCLYV